MIERIPYTDGKKAYVVFTHPTSVPLLSKSVHGVVSAALLRKRQSRPELISNEGCLRPCPVSNSDPRYNVGLRRLSFFSVNMS